MKKMNKNCTVYTKEQLEENSFETSDSQDK